METFKSRKFIFGMMLSIMAFVLVVVGKITAQEWVTFEAVIGATYVVGNVAETALRSQG